MRIALVALLLCLPALAADPAPKPKPAVKPATKKKPAAPMFSMPSLGEVPKVEGMSGTQSQGLGMDTKEAGTAAKYSVVKVIHARAFGSSSKGLSPLGGALEAVRLKGTPPVTEKFSSVIRVKSPQRLSAPIEVAILDPRGDTALSASGEISYRGGNSDETEWVVEWSPTPLRGGGDYSVLVRVAGEPLGTWPLKIVAEK